MKLSISGLTLISGLELFSSKEEFALSTMKDLLNGEGSGYEEEVLGCVSISPYIYKLHINHPKNL